VLQPAKLYKLKHLSKMEVVTNDPSGCTFTLVISHSFLLSYLTGSEYNVPRLWNITKSRCSQFLLWSFFLNAFCISLLCLFLFANAYISYRGLITLETRAWLLHSGQCAIRMTGYTVKCIILKCRVWSFIIFCQESDFCLTTSVTRLIEIASCFVS